MRKLNQTDLKIIGSLFVLVFLFASVLITVSSLDRTEKTRTSVQAAETSIGGTEAGLQYERSSYPPDTSGTCFLNSNRLIGQSYDPSIPKYYANRVYGVYSTEYLPDNATITSATLVLHIYTSEYTYYDFTTTDFTLNIRGKPGGYNPGDIGCEDWQSSFSGYVLAGAYWTGNLPSAPSGVYIDISISVNNDPSYSWINKLAPSGLVLSSNREESNNQPTGDEWFKLTKIGSTRLVITYTTPSPPPPPPPPPTKPAVSISANPSLIISGQTSTLSWSSTDATSVAITPDIGTVGTSGSRQVKPSASISYTAVATGAGGNSDPAYASITVDGKPPPKPPGPQPPGPGPSGTLETLQLQVSVPYLVGKMKIPVVVGGLNKEIEVSPDKKDYQLDVKGANIPIGSSLTVVVGGNKTLIKKNAIKAEGSSQTFQIGDLILGDILSNNIIDSGDELVLIKSITSQSRQGDLNADGATNSIDWAILLINFGKRGDT